MLFLPELPYYRLYKTLVKLPGSPIAITKLFIKDCPKNFRKF